MHTKLLLLSSLLLLKFCGIVCVDYLEDEDDDLEVEDVSVAESEGEYNFVETGRKGKFLLFPQNPIVDIVLQASPNHTSFQSSRDPFEFIRDSYPLPKGFKSPLAEYDYVIVGGGSAGSVLASRLTEDKPRATVLLIEAGKPEMLLTDVPALAAYFQRTDYAWQYATEYQPGACAGMVNHRCFWPRGKALGGTSVINYMLYTRGRPQEWNRIAADGNPGWSYDEILPYFIKSEKACLKDFEDSPYHGKNGKISVTDIPFRTQLVGAFLQAGRENGVPTVDYNAPEQLGFGFAQVNQFNGRRFSAAKAFLHPHKKRKNLHILTETRATKIIIDQNTRRATGVEYVRNNMKYTVKARREVILSAGPMGSPQLLMLSGIGPESHLKELGIPCIQNLNVGQTLYDHLTFPGVIFELNTTTKSFIEEKAATIPNFVQWVQFGDGMMTSPGAVEGLGYIKTEISDDPEEVPDIELISIGGSIASDGGGAVRKGMRITDEVYNTAFAPMNNKDTWSAFPMLLHPKSKGFMRLRDRNPFSFPKFYANYLTDQRDVQTFIAAIRYIIKLGESPAFRKFGAKLYKYNIPNCRQFIFNSDEFWECALRTLTVTLHHQIATCKMGPYTDSDAVVDSQLKVYGVEGLRIADSSIIPRTTSAHTHAPAMMIGEKAADLIKQTWSNKNRYRH